MTFTRADVDQALKDVRNKQYDSARPVLEGAVKLNATNRAICLALSEIYRGTERWKQSAATLKPLLDATPDDHRARYYYGMSLLESGRANEALEAFNILISKGEHLSQAYYMQARALQDTNQISESHEAFKKAHNIAPTGLSLQALANFAFMTDDMEAFDALLQSAPPPLKLSAFSIYLEAGLLNDAERVWRDLPEAHQNCGDGQNLYALLLMERGKNQEAHICAERAVASDPESILFADTLVTTHLTLGNGKMALEALQMPRRAQPLNQHFIAHEATAYRLMGDDRYTSIYNTDRFVRTYDLPVPSGYSSIEAFNAEFAQVISTEHPYKAHPINQTLRNGTQSAQSLTDMEHPVVKAYIAALWEPIQTYLGEIGQKDGHVFLERNTGSYEIAGCWSVRLFWGGHHVNHVHPNGWISSSYYVEVPEEVATTKKRAGWIKFGEPPYKTAPKLKPLKWVQPKAGQLVLFPSYMWHGTEPLTENAMRVTAPFDLVPG